MQGILDFTKLCYSYNPNIYC